MKEVSAITRARLQFNKLFPHLAPMMANHTIQYDGSLTESAGTNDGKRNILLNEKYFESLRPEERVGMLWIEIERYFRLHFSRRGNRNRKKWTHSCNVFLNYALKDDTPSGCRLPNGGVYNEKLAKDRSPEMIFKELGSNGNDDLSITKGIEDVSEFKSQEEVEDYESKVSRDQDRAINLAKAAGNLPGYMEELVNSQRVRQLPWDQWIKGQLSISHSGMENYSRPNHSRGMNGVIVPTFSKRVMPELALILDTSGSMWPELSKLLSVMSQVKETSKRHLRVIMVDTRVAEILDFPPGSPIKDVKLRGGGGTSFRPGFKEVRPTTSHVVYVTDGYCSDYPNPPKGVKVLWVVTSDLDFHPPFGTVKKVKL